jgi:hypothetical protein
MGLAAMLAFILSSLMFGFGTAMRLIQLFSRSTP